MWAPFLSLVVASGCRVRPKALPPATPISTTASQSSAYAGSFACRECHKSEYETERHSHHARTLRPATLKSLGKDAPPTGQIEGTAYSVKEADGEFIFTSSGTGVGSAKLEYALGSGIANMTFVGRLTDNGLTEFRLSYNPSIRKWFLTPGQETSDDLELGTAHPAGTSRQCIQCHCDAQEPGTNRPIQGSLGVGCESCHGPGARHISTIRNGTQTANLAILNPGKTSPHEINMACGKCHRTIDDVSLTGLAPVNTARFQPYAIEISDCYRKSGNRLSCITCHNAHTDASTDINRYEKVCLSCHNSIAGSKVCPVNPRQKCIGCHMPQKRVLPGTSIPLKMTDHFIWAYRPGH